MVFQGSGRGREQRLTHPDLTVGRSDPSRAYSPDLDLAPDLRVSRRHARLRRDGMAWLIEDLGSRHGTLVGGQEIKGRGPVELSPGTPVRMGDTTWATVPAGHLLISRGEILVHGPYARTLNYAGFHCGLPLLGSLRAANFGSAASKRQNLRFRIAGLGGVCHLEVPPLEPGRSVLLDAPPLRLRAEHLSRLAEPVRTRIEVLADGEAQPVAEDDMLLLGFWDWSYEPRARRTLAAFVSPRNPVVRGLVANAQKGLGAAAGTESFGAFLRSGRDDAERVILETLYQTLAVGYRIEWSPPEAGRSPEAGEAYQTISPPHRMFRDAASREGKGTCLDLALLAAACLESIGLCPVVVLTGRRAEVPQHALAGCWLGPAPGDRPVLTDAGLLRREVGARNLLLADWTALAVGVGERLDAPGAFARARDQVSSSPWLCAVDIAALRPPRDSITPIDAPLEPEVVQAYAEAEGLAAAKGRASIETTHLLCGILGSGGPVIRRLCEQAGLDAREACQRIRDSIAPEQAARPPVPTRNLHECQHLAQELAWASGVRSVREQDVLWALLLKARDSEKFRAKCAAVGVEPERLARLLAEDHPPPELAFATSSQPSYAAEE